MNRVAAALAAVSLWAAALGAQTVQPGDPPVIVAQGEAILMKVPDRAWVTVGAEGRAAKPAEAQRIGADAMTSVQSALKGLGFGSDVLRTTGYTLQPEYDYNNGRQTFRDYVSRQTLEVRIDDLKKLPDALDAAGASGAASVNSLRFDLKDKAASEQDALRLAVKDAVARAEAIAAGAGRSVGAIVRIQEQRVSTPSPIFSQAGMAAGGGGGRGGAAFSTPIESGEVQVRAQVTLSVAIK